MTEMRMLMYKHYSIDELEKTYFWHLLEPDGVDFHYVYNKKHKYAYFMPNNEDSHFGLAHARKMNNYKRTIFKRKIISSLLDKTKIWLPEIKRQIITFIGFDSYINNTKINDFGLIRRPFSFNSIYVPLPVIEDHELLIIDNIEEQNTAQ
tara:strand:+ start:509 stop:958 length:450 start_codon:yes stop_codon:yes gene_type:complete